ncbi:DNA-binding transcriptional response regulator, NtrC family, contains REC, AAA-type ATPase, and a Fis-type DNA-binding domains [Desulfocicer vacuolatum DSM 3385]|uniref:DNA-binding transcriptional response regulator, NtrC family, contains REC, AAA-type ATPase, and a Fis-type DNA-binding domains n=1 Tax=Desulfocicer vacuolatum DSM 3385 TaxID=1121400 RepID=A0A1W2D5X7_9BACT|nr:sigma-54 dependent transcriptional regulator [Desulfocicer vacuolatum]SMC92564.1 DNA-binding transcriptional response regulator, NtrC family, contains REC, AAA-type ATPase, and a Fis-type DNA-binding domains [Desulfocicer vacuolatum DSM 3385]
MQDSLNNLQLNVFSTTSVDEGFSQIGKFLKKHFPFDMLNIPIYDSEKGVLHYKCIYSEGHVMMVDEPVKLSSKARHEVAQLLENTTPYYNDSGKSQVLKEVADYIGIPGVFSTIGFLLGHKPGRYLLLGIVCLGKNRYTQAHVRAAADIAPVFSGIIKYLFNLIDAVNYRESLRTENQELKKRLGYLKDARIIGSSSGLRRVLTQVTKIAPLQSPVLLIGETGVGKEVIANAIHQRSSRSNTPLISLNCGAIPESLLDSELFGYEKGAFTGANKLKRGYFEQANGGTIFLDEVGELSLMAQVKLLRIIQTMTLQRVGGERSVSIDVRILAATNRNLESMINSGEFRQDLWFRLNVFPITIPPLRKRRQDIHYLTEHFILNKCNEMNISPIPALTPDNLSKLQIYDWPGNVRELQNVIERALIISPKGQIVIPNLSETSDKTCQDTVATDNFYTDRFLTMNEMMIQHIVESLKRSKGKIEGSGGAAELLDMNPSTLRGRMRKLGIQINMNVKSNR